MKKAFFLATALLFVLASCSKVTQVAEQDQAITFQVVKYANSTKADADAQKPAEYQGTPFGTFAFMNSYESEQYNWANAGSTANVYMDNVRVSKVDTPDGSLWAPSSTYYWPKSATLTFASYSPYKGDKITVDNKQVWPVSYDYEKGYVIPNYTIVDSFNEDLMVSDLENATDLTANNNKPEYYRTGVPTLFRHLLTDLQFQFKRASYSNDNVDESKSKIVVKEVELINFVDTKSFGTEIKGEWTPKTAAVGATSYKVITNGSLELVATKVEDEEQYEYPIVPETPRDVIIMPQALVAVPADYKPQTGVDPTSFQALKITYDIITYFDGREDYVPERNIVGIVPFYGSLIPSSTGVANEFLKNQKIVYTVTIYPYANDDPIRFDPAVAAWDDTTTGEFTIN